MKKIIAFISAFFILFSCVANAAYTGIEIYNIAEQSFEWADNNISPLGNTDSVAADYCIMAKKRAGKPFDYYKYIQITNSKTPITVQDAHRIITANTAAGGSLSDEFIAEYTYNQSFTRASDKAGAITALLSGEYEVNSDKNDINRLAVDLLGMQNIDGGFDGDALSTAKSIIALSFLSGKCYIVKGTEMGEKYRYDVNSAILRGVDYLQNNKNADYGYGSVLNTAFVIMALDCAGVDSDNDPGFSDGMVSTFGALLSNRNADGSFGTHPDDTAIALCAIVSHLRAMQGNSPFFALRTEDMPYNPNEYIEDINRSGEGLKVATQDEIEVSLKTSEILPKEKEKPYELSTAAPIETESHSTERKSEKAWYLTLIIIGILATTAIMAGLITYFVYIRPKKKGHSKKYEEDEDD